MEKDFFNMLSNAIIDTQVDGKNILYFSGKFAGYNYFKVKNVKNIEGLEKLLDRILKELLIGSVEDIVKKHNKLVIKIRGDLKPKKYFLTGFITGMVSKALNYNFYKFTGKEIAGGSNGSYCNFEITSI